MGETDWENEKCWQIVESRPIKAKKVKNRNNNWDIEIEPMTMHYNTFISICSKIEHLQAYGVAYSYEKGKPSLSVTAKGLSDLMEMNNIILITD